MNARKFARTTNEAFPHGAEYGCAIERPSPRLADTVAKWLMYFAAFYIAVILAVERYA